MGRRPKPWYRKERKEWYVTINKVTHRLGESKKEAYEEFHKLMASDVEVPSGSVWEIFDAMLEWTKTNRAPRTYDFYQERLQRFKDDVPNMLIARLTPDHVYQWLSGKKWSDTYKRGCVTSMARAFNWAVKARKISFNPIRGIEKPEAANREVLITPKEFETILGLVKDEPFRDVLNIIWLTGCRPFEASRVEKRHVQPGCWIFPKAEGKGKKPRVVFLVPEAEEITKKWADRFPEGPIFRNNRGRKWTAFAFNNRFKRLKEKIGKKVFMYALRHSYAHHALTKGKLDPVVTAQLLGHSNTNMLLKVYGHLLKDGDFMREAAEKVRKGASLPPEAKQGAST
jgi:integrase